MKRISLISILLVAIFILAACSSPNATLSDQAARIFDSAASALKAESSSPAEKPEAKSQTTPPPVVPAEAYGLVAAYEGVLESVYAQVNPSVVNIQVLVNSPAMNMQIPEIPGLPFNFPGIPGMPESPNGEGLPPLPEGQPYGIGAGSGFVWDKQGHIITNNHVVAEAEKIEVTFSDGSTVSAEIVGSDPDSDLAVLKVDVPSEKLEPVTIGDSSQVRPGQLAIAIGNPFGLEGTMTVGIISAMGRTMPAGEGTFAGPVYSIPDVIQTDAPINPGNSGGVLVDDQGEVIGVTFAIESPVRANAGIGFAIPAIIVQRVVPALIEKGSYAHPYLGISGTDLTPDLAEEMDLDTTQRGTLIVEIVPDGPAEKAGLRGSDKTVEINGQEAIVGGDVIIAIDGDLIQGMDDLIAYLANNTAVDKVVTLTVLRDGKQTDVDVVLESRPEKVDASQTGENEVRPARQPTAWLGITTINMNPEIAGAMDLPSNQTGVLIEQVEANSPADEAGLRGSDKALSIENQQILVGGDVIIAIDGEKVTIIQDLLESLLQFEPDDKVTITVIRDNKEVDVEVTLGERPM